MERYIEKAAALIEALPYIQQFRGETVVVKFGGSIMEDHAGVRAILKDIAFMECVGLRPVIVHGGGKAISRRLRDKSIASQFVQGLRVTPEAALREVEHVLNHEVNPTLVDILCSYGCKARGMHGDDIIHAARRTGTDPETGESMDWGHVGEALNVDIEPIRAFQAADIVPVITPLGRDRAHTLYNINADEVANSVARELSARKLVFLSDVPGLLEDATDPRTLISTLRLGEVDTLIRRGVISGGMLPKIAGAVAALRAGVRKVHVIDSGMPHSLLLELFTERGVGTEIVADTPA